MSYIKTIVAAAVVALAIIFMIQNIGPLSHPLSIRLNLLFVKFESTPYATYLVILLAFFVGLLIASLLGWAERMKLRGAVRQRARKIDDLNRELSSLRNLPVTNESLSPLEDKEPDSGDETKEALS